MAIIGGFMIKAIFIVGLLMSGFSTLHAGIEELSGSYLGTMEHGPFNKSYQCQVEIGQDSSGSFGVRIDTERTSVPAEYFFTAENLSDFEEGKLFLQTDDTQWRSEIIMVKNGESLESVEIIEYSDNATFGGFLQGWSKKRSIKCSGLSK